MKYIKVIDEQNYVYPYNLNNLKIDFPNTSFSPNSDLSDWGIHIVTITSKPTDQTKNYTESLVYENNQWIVNWVESNKTTEELVMVNENKWNEIRFERNSLLKDSDFTMCEDYPYRELTLNDWKQYRESLRNLTTQEDPFNITWPIKPV